LRPPGRRRCILNENKCDNKFSIGLLTVLALVVLRLCLGCHFLYEGVWKIEHRDQFTAEPFLSQAKGPLAGFFYAMIPDINGRQRLHVITDENGKKRIDSDPIATRWIQYRQDLVNYLIPRNEPTPAALQAYQQFETESEKTYQEFKKSLEVYFAANLDRIEAYFGALDRFEKSQEAQQDAPFQKQRRWNRMMELRGEANLWIKEIEGREASYKKALYELMDDKQREKIASMPVNWKIWQWDRMELINLAVTYGLSAIGLCLVLGLFTRLAALGGAAFMCFVVMTQPAWPTIYPPDPDLVGHALLINKDFIEMVALLVIAASAAGRWGGLDFIVHRLFVKPFCKKT
jgi:uncharacterized membrane protein YphA (DoxX/SURF4 family)